MSIHLQCAYCNHTYSDKVREEVSREVLDHIFSLHPQQWKMVRPNDHWVREIK